MAEDGCDLEYLKQEEAKEDDITEIEAKVQKDDAEVDNETYLSPEDYKVFLEETGMTDTMARAMIRAFNREPNICRGKEVI